MKKLISLLLALTMLLCLGVAAYADEAEDTWAPIEGWSVTNDNYLGWSQEGDEIIGDFNIGWENAEPMKLWQDMITDYNNFRVELDMIANNMTSPAIAVMGVRVEADGNGGDGQQIYLKTNNTEGFEGRNQTYDWLKAANAKVHIVIARKDGGDLNILIVGESNSAVQGEFKLLTIPVANETPTIEIMVYRGCAKFANLTVTEGEGIELPTEPTVEVPIDPPEETPTDPPEEIPTDPPAEEPGDNIETEPSQPSDPGNSGNTNTEPTVPSTPAGNNSTSDVSQSNNIPGILVLIGGIIVVIAAVATPVIIVGAVIVLIIVIKKKKTK